LVKKLKPTEPVTHRPSHREPPQPEILDTFFRSPGESLIAFDSSDYPERRHGLAPAGSVVRQKCAGISYPA
ncbi:MAG TPA: hypothetical protein VND95_04310, partial [Stellaceae bacterium]|nr:hypothetical protein [Stellaceae bacterium]